MKAHKQGGSSYEGDEDASMMHDVAMDEGPCHASYQSMEDEQDLEKIRDSPNTQTPSSPLY